MPYVYGAIYITRLYLVHDVLYIVFRLGIIGMMKRILDSMIRIIGKNFENTRIE